MIFVWQNRSHLPGEGKLIKLDSEAETLKVSQNQFQDEIHFGYRRCP